MEYWGTGVRERGLNPTLSSQTRKLRQREVPRLAGHQVSQRPSSKQRALMSSLSGFHGPILQPPDNKWTFHSHYLCFYFLLDSCIRVLRLPSQHQMTGGLHSSSVLPRSLASGSPRSAQCWVLLRLLSGPQTAVFSLCPPSTDPRACSKQVLVDSVWKEGADAGVEGHMGQASISRPRTRQKAQPRPNEPGM